MMWDQSKFKKHLRACELLDKIKNEAFDFIRVNENVSEYSVQQFILKRFKELGLKMDRDPPIVAFNESAATPHYFPKRKSKKLKNNSLVLIDIWARLNKKEAPFSDITWMGYCGKKMSKDVLKIYDLVIKSRDESVKFLRSQLRKGMIPTGREVDDVVRSVIVKAGYGKNFMHGTGHSLGTTSPHGGYGHLRFRNKKRLSKNLGYTIVPGIYLKGKFGVRSEINFFIDKNMKLVITTPVQKKMIRIN